MTITTFSRYITLSRLSSGAPGRATMHDEDGTRSEQEQQAMTATNTVSEATLARMRMREQAREKERVLRDIDKAWRAFMDSIEGIPESLTSEEDVSGTC